MSSLFSNVGTISFAKSSRDAMAQVDYWRRARKKEH